MSNAVAHHAKFLLAGIAEPFVLRVSAEESERLQKAFDMYEGHDARFILVETLAGDLVAISVPDVQAANFLFDLGVFEPRAPEETIQIYLRGRIEPFITATEGVEDSLKDAIASLEFHEAEFVQFTDEDGEELVLRPDHIICMVVPRRCLVEDDEDDLLSEIDSESTPSSPHGRPRIVKTDDRS